MEKPKSKYKRIVIGSVITFGTLLIIYLGMSIYFINHFYFGATINCINVAGKTVNEVNEEIATDIKNYALVLEEKGGVKEEIKGADIGLKYNGHDKVQSLKEDENPFYWISGIFKKKESKVSEIISFDKILLKKAINSLSCFNNSNLIEPKNASFKYTEKGYEIVEGISGNKVNKDILYNHVEETIAKGETTINLETINCYEKPQYTSDSKEVIAAKDILNKYVASKITYTFGEHKEVLDGSKINTWLKVDQNLKVTFDEEKVKNYVETMARTYDTYGDTRNFAASSGSTKKVSGGDYGWLVNRPKETKDLIAAIKEGKVITKEPAYSQTARARGNNDIGNTYVEIDLTKQYMWFYKNGNLIAKGDIVTGNLSSNHATPQGSYQLTYKQKDAILRGPGYAAPVSYWMPFNGDIGIHDATWRSAFGGNIYKTDGSHGCVNAPYKLAETIFNNIEAGVPVICYF